MKKKWYDILTKHQTLRMRMEIHVNQWAMQEQWRKYLQIFNFMNVESVFEVEKVTELQQRPVREELANPPSK